MKKQLIFIACDTTNRKKVKEIIQKTQNSNLNFGYQPISLLIKLGSIAYLKSWPNLSFTKTIWFYTQWLTYQ